MVPSCDAGKGVCHEGQGKRHSVSLRVPPLNPKYECNPVSKNNSPAGELVAFPTETVYGLGGDALDPEASKKIYSAKGRPSDNPLIVHLSLIHI